MDSLDVTQVSVLVTALDSWFHSLTFLINDKRLAVRAKLLQLNKQGAMESADVDSYTNGMDSPEETAPSSKK